MMGTTGSAFAQNNSNIINDLFNFAIKQTLQAEQRKQQMQQQQAQIIQVQTALQQLGFYNKTIDGVWGRGTEAGVMAYRRAFNLPQGEFTENDLQGLLSRAAQGWRDADEIRRAQVGGFGNRSELLQAERGGFQNRAQSQSALRDGFSDAKSYEAYRRSGFADPNSYRMARAGGFNNEKEYSSAAKLGFSTANEYNAFLRSGYRTKAAYDDALAKRQRIAANKEECTKSSENADWVTADKACRIAANANPDDPVIAAYAEAANTALEKQRNDLVAARDTALETLNTLLSNPEKLEFNSLEVKIAAARNRLDEIVGHLALVELQQDFDACAVAVAGEDWVNAKTVCGAALIRARSNPAHTEVVVSIADELVDMKSIADANAKDEAEKAAQERQRLALQSAKERGNELVEDVTAYSSRGNKFSDGLAVARALVGVRKALEGEDAATIEKYSNALSDLVDAEKSFVADIAEQKHAVKQAEIASAMAARNGAEQIDAFLKEYVSRNLMADNIGQLLELQSDLDEVLTGGNASQIATALAHAQEVVRSQGLTDQLGSFVASASASVVSGDDLARNQAATKAQSVQSKTAEKQASDMVAEVEDHSRAGGQFDDPIRVGKALVALRKALTLGELDTVLKANETMEAALRIEAEFLAARERRRAASTESRQNALVLAGEAGKSYNAFLLDYIARNLSVSTIDKLIVLQDRLDTALSSADWQQVMLANSAVEEYFIQNELQEDYIKFSDAQNAREESAAKLATAQNGITLNPVNQALLDGSDGEILLLQNKSNGAPNLAANLLGQLTFDNATAAVCWLNPIPNISTATLLADQKMRDLGVRNFIGKDMCGADYLAKADLVLVERGAFLRRSATDARPVILDFEQGKLAILLKISATDVAAFQSRQKATADKLKAQIDAEEVDGYSLVYLSAGNGDICVSTPSDMLAHQNLLSSQTEALSFYFQQGIPGMSSYTPDRAFVLAQRNLCAGIYADMKAMKIILAGLDREGIPHLLTPVWFSQLAYKDAFAKIDETKQQREARLLAQRQRAHAEAELQAQQDQTAEKLRKAKQENMRSETRDAAMGALKSLRDTTLIFLDQSGSSNFARLFPSTASIKRSLIADRWKITDKDITMFDYGTGIWRGRRVEAFLGRVEYRSENAVLGQYREDCAIVGYLIDTEFNQLRDSIETVCVDDGPIKNWKSSHQFESGWFAP
ncbi:MAG: peptidoglycan-binding domain-containing protein [Rhizobiaceae bacterium]|nr:peptidoglycan-binding domain-containing protein [Rhizobiaceae bacterium]